MITINDAVLQGAYSDFTLTINNKELKLHKLVLDNNEYFHNLFQDTNCKEATLTVEYPEIMEDVIRSLYGQIPTITTNEYLLTYIEYSDMYLISFPITMLYNLIIPEDKYDLLLRVSRLFPVTKQLVQTLKNNLPKTYNKELLPSFMLYPKQQVAKSTEDYIILPNAVIEDKVDSILYSSSNKYIIAVEHPNAVKLYDSQTGEHKYTFHEIDEIKGANTSPDESLLIIYTAECVLIQDIKTQKEFHTCYLYAYYHQVDTLLGVELSPNNKYLSILGEGECVELIDLETLNTTILGDTEVYYSAFTDDSRYFVYFDECQCVVVRTEDTNTVMEFNLTRDDFDSISFVLNQNIMGDKKHQSRTKVSVVYLDDKLTITENEVLVLTKSITL